MEIHWSSEATADFIVMIQYIRKDNSAAALRVARSIHQTVAQLNTFPNLGRPGRVDGTWELVLSRLPLS
jgi:toxin ParE1/3/4